MNASNIKNDGFIIIYILNKKQYSLFILLTKHEYILFFRAKNND